MKEWIAIRAYWPAMDRIASNRSYYLRRADEERTAAKRASDPRARESHIGLAARYADAARALDGGDSVAEAEPAASAPIPLLQPEFRILP